MGAPPGGDSLPNDEPIWLRKMQRPPPRNRQSTGDTLRKVLLHPGNCGTDFERENPINRAAVVTAVK